MHAGPRRGNIPVDHRVPHQIECRAGHLLQRARLDGSEPRLEFLALMVLAFPRHDGDEPGADHADDRDDESRTGPR
jgi:hypothetical protein